MNPKNNLFCVIVAFFLCLVLPARAGTEVPPPQAAPTCQNITIAPDLVLTRGDFGMFNQTRGGEEFVVTNKVPFAVGQNYGWKMQLKTTRPQVRWREEFQLPAIPKTWGTATLDPQFTLTEAGLKGIVERTGDVRNGELSDVWHTLEGDPRGAHSITVFLEGQKVCEFAFVVE